MLSIFQDEGRDGYQSYGIPSSGCMDKYAARLANLLVGKNPSEALLEINYIGPEFKIMGDLYIAITGADMGPTVDGEKIKMYQTQYIKEGLILKFKNAQSGNRAYLAIAGKINTGNWLGSQSAYVDIDIASLKANKLTKGARIQVENTKMINKKICPEEFISQHSANQTIRILPGPEYKWFSRDQTEFLTSRALTIHQTSNRMATIVKEQLPDYSARQELISSGVVAGTIQISNNGSPIILMRESGTTGGYPRIAKVIDTDINYLAQIPFGHQFNFEFISYEEAQQIQIEEKENWERLTKVLSSKLSS